MENENKEVVVKQSGWKSFWELVRFAIIAIAIVVPIRVFIAQPFIVSGSSMVPTFHDGEYLIVDEISYRIGSPSRDDVVIFRYPNDQKKYFIKRIIGLPGETVKVDGKAVTIINKDHPNGFVLNQDFVKNISEINDTKTLKDDEYYVMGDNRSASFDSRSWGPVQKKLLIGRALLRLLPISEIGLFPGSYNQAE